tara:strand:+ start:1493 stop:2404 length:912 start_codon:yes stop_codon:yes gene_type:complete
MSLNTRRLYLNSVNSNINDSQFDGKVNFDLTRASINCRNDQMIAMSLVRAELPATCGIISDTNVNFTQPNNLILQVNHTAADGGVRNVLYIFNINKPDTNPNHVLVPLTLQTTITDMLIYINSSSVGTIVKQDDATQTFGLFRLIGVGGGTTTFIISATSPEIARALGLNTNANTVINDTDATPYNYDMAQVLPSIRLRTNFNFDSESSNNSADNSILDSVPTALSEGNQFFELNTIATPDGTLNIKNKSLLVHENHYMSQNILPTKSVTNLSISLVSQDNKPVTVNQQPFAFVIQIDILDSL